MLIIAVDPSTLNVYRISDHYDYGHRCPPYHSNPCHKLEGRYDLDHSNIGMVDYHDACLYVLLYGTWCHMVKRFP